MAGPDKGDQAMQRIFNKEGVTATPTDTAKKTSEEKLQRVTKNCDSGPGHSEQTRPFYQKNHDQMQKYTPTSQDDTN